MLTLLLARRDVARIELFQILLKTDRMPLAPESSNTKFAPKPAARADAAAAMGTVAGFWHGRPLGDLRRLCLASQLRTGYRVKLFSYEPLAGLPAGVENLDAHPILPARYLDQLQVFQLSDFFRIRLQEMGIGIWLDTDVYLLRAMNVDPAMPYFARENRRKLNNSVLYLPPKHPIVTAYNQMLEHLEVLPAWVPMRYRLSQLVRRLRGKPAMPWNLRSALYGPGALTVLARRTGSIQHALPPRSFYAIHGKPALFYEKHDFATLIEDPRVIGLHITPQKWEGRAPAEGSLYQWALRNERSVD